ncbi:type VII secretion protein EccB [Streptomyces sp. R1]|uniref:type VII secretion protein EccB n=1 Tax=Streptomyces sp. R1 TaxID=1509279 RepID=UPI001E35C002|nr:type VII secretion protein EccB [Streptomyces sp. R1]MCC8338951.1 type VII secretion protein EccB [Streptomyces sp. R1]
MDSKRDQVQAHMFMMGRLTSGMLRADPDSAESPQGRTNRGIVIGVIIAVLVAAGAFVIGLIKPGGNNSWREDGTLVVNKDTGSRYLYLSGRLRPLRNYASAKLLLGSDVKAASVGTKSLAGTPHGAPVGIPGAPDALPGTGELSDGPWQLCSMPRETGPDGSRITTLAIGHDAFGSDLTKTQGLLVRDPGGDVYLLWRGSKLKVDSEHGALEALGYGSLKPVPVSAALLGSLPAGPDLAPEPVEDLGAKGPVLDGYATRVGQLFKVSVPGTAPQLYRLSDKGLLPVNETQAALVLGDARTRELAYRGSKPTVTELGADALGDHLAAAAEESSPDTGLPPAPPNVLPLDGEKGLCVRVSGTGTDSKGLSTSIGLVGAQQLGSTAQPASDYLDAACLPVDRVTVPAGKAVVVEALSAAGGVLGSTTYLVTDDGAKYRISSSGAADALGYGSAPTVGMPSLLLSMLPTGPDLSLEAAEQGRPFSTAPRCGKSTAQASASPTGSPSAGASASADATGSGSPKASGSADR